MAEDQAKHRQKMEAIVIQGNSRREWLGQVLAGVVFVFAIYKGSELLMAGRDIAGYISLITGLGAPLALFLNKKSEERKDIRQKNRLPAPSGDQPQSPG